MQFVLRQDGDETNPSLARCYGPDQSTRGRVVLWERDGDRTKLILLLAQGGRHGCDGINEYHYEGTDIPEFEVGHEDDEDFRNWKFYPGTRSLGYDDPIQGRPWCFPDLDETYSRKCYLAVKLPADVLTDPLVVPDGSEVFMRGLKVMHYDLVDGLLEETTAAVSANNALVGMDLLREVQKVPLSRFQPHAQKWKDFEARCDELIEWDKGVDFGGVVDIPRYEANCVFSSSISPVAAFQTVVDRAPGVQWHPHVDGGILVEPDYDRDPIHTFNSFNILKKGVVLTPRDPSTLYNFYIFLFRDVDSLDADTGQLLYKQSKVEIDLASLRDAIGGKLRSITINLGGGPMHRSLAERIGWFTVRNLTAINAEGDMLADDMIFPIQFEVKGQMDSFRATKIDQVEISDHYMVNLQTPLCNVLKEVTHGHRGERTFQVQLTSRQMYRDTDHTEYIAA